MAARNKPASHHREHALQVLQQFRTIVQREGWTHEEAARISLFSFHTIGRWLRGNHVPTSRQMIEAIEKFNAKWRTPKE